MLQCLLSDDDDGGGTYIYVEREGGGRGSRDTRVPYLPTDGYDGGENIFVIGCCVAVFVVAVRLLYHFLLGGLLVCGAVLLLWFNPSSASFFHNSSRSFSRFFSLQRFQKIVLWTVI